MKKVSIIIPCYNEEEGIPQLAERLDHLLNDLKKTYDLELIFVDDGSTDNTYSLLNKTFGHKDYFRLIKHEKNMNLGASIRDGFKMATGDIVCTIDSDCSYDPMILKGMIQKLGPDFDIVSASALHPEAKFIRKIPGYRILLSKSIVAIYNIILGRKGYSYTSMVRAYKGKVTKDIQFKSDDFLAMTEIAVKAVLKGYSIYEYPPVYNYRKFGVSKIRMLRVIKCHLIFIFRLLNHKIFKTSL